jgi:ABC-type sugar transport system substrate-binding protein
MKTSIRIHPVKIVLLAVVLVLFLSAAGIPASENPPIPCRITFDTDRDGNREIYVMEPDGSNQTNLTDNKGQDENPVWSPDGKQIAFVSNRENGKEGGQFIYVMNADGSDVRQLTSENESKWPDWSPDGKTITYTHNGDIFVIQTDGIGESVNQTNSPEEDRQSKWSPDSKKILWLSGNKEKPDIFTMDADGTNKNQVTKNAAVNDATWSVDGRIFGHWDSKEGGCFNCIMNADGTKITNAGGKGDIQKYLPFWTIDGHQVELISGNQNNGNDEIYLVSPIFPDIFLNITNSKGNDRNPDWPVMCGDGRENEIATQTPPGNPEKADPTPVVAPPIILGYAGNDGWNYMREHDFTKACDEIGAQCVIKGTIQELLKQGATAIIQDSGAVLADRLADEVKPALEKGIPVFILDTEADIKGAYFVSIDRREWVKASMGFMLEKLGGKGQFTYFDHSDEYDDASVIKELISQYPEIEVIEFQEGDFDPQWVQPQTNDILVRKPDVKAVWSDGNPDLLVQALKSSNLPADKWPLINCDANQAGLEFWAETQKKSPNFDCVAPVNPPGIAYDAAYAAYYLASGMVINPSALGGPNKNSLFLPMPVIDKESRQKWAGIMGKEAFFADALMKPDEIKEKWFTGK